MWRMSRLTQDGTAEPGSRDQIIRHERGQKTVQFPCSADPEKDWANNISLSSAFAPENLVSRDGLGSPVPRQPAHLHIQSESGHFYITFQQRASEHLTEVQNLTATISRIVRKPDLFTSRCLKMKHVFFSLFFLFHVDMTCGHRRPDPNLN